MVLYMDMISLNIFVFLDLFSSDGKINVKVFACGVLLGQQFPARKLQLGAWDLCALHTSQHFPSFPIWNVSMLVHSSA